MLAFACVVLMAPAPQTPPPDLEALLAARQERFGRYLTQRDAFRLQVAVATVDAGAAVPKLRRETLGDLDRYFYPASSIKTCAAVAALLDLNEVNASRGTAFGVASSLTVGTLFDGDRERSADASNLEGGRMTIGHSIRQLFLVSSNQAYNDLYELVGHEPLNRRMWAAGFASCRVLHRLSEFRSVDDQRRSRPVVVRDVDGAELARPVRESELRLDNAGLAGLNAGDAFWRGGERVAEPFSFRFKNRISLVDLQDLLVELIRPEVDTGKRGFPELSVRQRAFLRRAMRQLPRESDNPVFDPERVPDDAVKLFLPGLRRVVPAASLAVYNKVGRAYGFSVDNAYVEDLRTGRGFFLAAVLYTNPNRTLNDDTYAYDTLADPFFADLAEAVARALWSR